MADVAATSHRRFRWGRVLKTLFAVYFRNIILFTLISLTAWLPVLVYVGILVGVFSAAPVSENNSGGIDLVTAMQIFGATLTSTVVISLLLYLIGIAVIVAATFQFLTEGRVRLRDAIKQGLARSFWVLLLGLLMGLALVLMMTALAALAMSGSGGRTPAQGSLLGISLPLFYPMAVWIAAVPVCVVERLGPIRSFGRSRRLTKGYRWPIVGILIVAIIVFNMADYCTELALAPLTGNPNVLLFAMVTMQGALSAFLFVLPGVLYDELLWLGEGKDVQKIATVFD